MYNTSLCINNNDYNTNNQGKRRNGIINERNRNVNSLRKKDTIDMERKTESVVCQNRYRAIRNRAQVDSV